MAPNIHFIGLLQSPVSWAKVGRELVCALARRGARVSAVSLKGYLYDEDYAKYLPPQALEAALRTRLPGWDLALDYPPNFARLSGARKAGILIYEADRFPSHWVDAINRYLDLAFVPSAFCMDAAARSGISADKLRLLPFGVDTEVYSSGGSLPGMSAGKAFNFLTVSAAHIRKGLKELTDAFCQAFGPDEDVGLVIKFPAPLQLGRNPWEYARKEDFLPEGRCHQIFLLAAPAAELWMAGLYRAHDVYVQASYGEAFGLAAVEAAACGKPIITTNWGAAAELWSDESAYLVDYDLVDARSFSYDWRGGEVLAARPKTSSLAAALRSAYENPEARARKAAAALQTARALTWDAAAHSLLGHLA